MPFSGLPDRVAEIRGKIDAARRRGGHGQDVRIVAVTKTHGPDAVIAALEAGLIDIGENKVQEAVGKQDALAGRAAITGGMQAIVAGSAPRAPRWHLIGHLQRNKVKFLDRFSLFHAVDSVRLADAVNELGEKRGIAVDVLLEVNVSGESSKHGFSLSQMEEVRGQVAEKRGIRVIGVMTMAPFEADEATLRRVFAGARDACELCRQAGMPTQELSMGMSGDYEVAVEEGATMVRLGTVLFGERHQ
jgi:pyridoxal phosphate enzyme (YggS family)